MIHQNLPDLRLTAPILHTLKCGSWSLSVTIEPFLDAVPAPVNANENWHERKKRLALSELKIM